MDEKHIGRTARGLRAVVHAFEIAIVLLLTLATPLQICLAQADIKITPAKQAGNPDEPALLRKEPGPGALIVQAHQVTADSTAGNSVATLDRILLQKLRDAERFVEQNDLGSAIGSLQEILDSTEDGFIVDAHGGDEVRRGWKVAAREHLTTILQRDAGAYERLVGSTARRLLDQATNAGDPEQLKSVSLRYFHAEAGKDAMVRLAAYYFDHDQPLMAAVCYKRLHQLPDYASRHESTLSVQLALCQVRGGQFDAARETLAAWRTTHGDRELRVGDRTVVPTDPKGDPIDWLFANFGKPFQADRQSATGENRVKTVPAIASPNSRTARMKVAGWSIPTFAEARDSRSQDPSQALFDALFSVSRGDAIQSGINAPRSMPLIIDGTVIYRTIGNLIAMDVQSGQTLWQSELDSEIARFLPSPETTHRGASSLHTLRKLVMQRTWQDSNYGTLTTDGQSVFSIENLGLARAYKDSQSKLYVVPKSSNRLVARDVLTGNVIWSREESGDDSNSGGLFWLGAPLPVRGELLALADENRQVKLISLDPATGAVRWAKAVALTGTDITDDFYRRLCNLTPVVADGLIVVPTGTGSVVAVDHESRQFVWAFTPAETDDAQQGDVQFANVAPVNRQSDGTTDWFDTQITLAGDKLLVRPRGVDSIVCLDVKTGSSVWKQKCDGYWFLAGVSEGNAVLVGGGSVIAYEVTTGRAAWKRPLALHHPRGRTFIADGILYVPMRSGEVAAVRLSTGQLISNRRITQAERLGNLVRSGDVVVSQDVKSVSVFPFVPARTQDVAETSLPSNLPTITPGQRNLR